MNLAQTLATRVADMHAAAPRPPFLVAICGWADTGKSTLADNLCTSLGALGIGADWISTDAFLRSRAERNALGISGYNPMSIDAVSLAASVNQMVNRQAFTYYPYDNRTGSKTIFPKTIIAQPALILEGVHAFHPAISKESHLRIFIDSDDDTLRAMRVRANVAKRGMGPDDACRRIESELEDYRKFTLPMKPQAQVMVEVSFDFQYSVRE